MVNKQEFKCIKDRGSALLTVIFVVILFMIINGLLFFIMSYRAKIENSEENTMKAYYLALAAVNYGGSLLKTSATVLNEETINNPFGNSYGGSFSVKYTTISHANPGWFTVNVKGTGYYPSGANSVKRVINTSYLWKTNDYTSDSGTIQQQLVVLNGGGNSTLVFANGNTQSALPTDGSRPKLLHAIVNQPYPLSAFVWTNGGSVRGSNTHITDAKFKLLDLNNNSLPIKLQTALTTMNGTPLSETATGSNIYKIPYFTADKPPLFYITINQPYSNVKWHIEGNIATGNSAGGLGVTVTETAFSVTLPLNLVTQQEGN